MNTPDNHFELIQRFCDDIDSNLCDSRPYQFDQNEIIIQMDSALAMSHSDNDHLHSNNPFYENWIKLEIYDHDIDDDNDDDYDDDDDSYSLFEFHHNWDDKPLPNITMSNKVYYEMRYGFNPYSKADEGDSNEVSY